MAVAVNQTTTNVVTAQLRGRRGDVAGSLFAAGLLSALLFSLLILLFLLWDVVRTGWPVLTARGVGFLTAGPSSFPAEAGIGAALVGSFVMMLIVAAVAFPIGIGAAVYLEEYARNTRLTRFISTNVRNLAGVPSIVYGILGLVLFVGVLNRIIDIRDTGSLLSGGLTLAALVLPIVIITTSEALRAVPSSLREAAFGVGATRWEVIRHHVLPAAAPRDRDGHRAVVGASLRGDRSVAPRRRRDRLLLHRRRRVLGAAHPLAVLCLAGPDPRVDYRSQ